MHHTAVKLINIHTSALPYVYGCLAEIDHESRCGDADDIINTCIQLRVEIVSVSQAFNHCESTSLLYNIYTDEVPILKAPQQTTARCSSSKPRGLRQAAGANQRGRELSAMVSRFFDFKTEKKMQFIIFGFFWVLSLSFLFSCLVLFLKSTQQSRLFAITSTSSATSKKASKESPKGLVTRARSRWKKNNYNWLRNYDNWRAEGQVKFWVRELPNLVDFALPYVLLG